MNRWRRASWTLRWVARTWPRGKDGRDPVTWVWKAFHEKTTPAGKALCGIWSALLPISVLTRGNFGGAAFAMVSAALVAGWLRTLRSPRARASASPPATMREEETVSVRVSLRATGKDLPVGIGAWIFRTGDGLDAPGDGAAATRVSMGAGTVDVPLLALKRGLQVVEGASVLLPEPLGLFRSRSLEAACAQVLVLPRACRVVSLEALVEGPDAEEFAEALKLVAGNGEFVGIRPWRDGDDMRSVHHRAWARTGRPMVRETERETGGGVVLSFSSDCETWTRRGLADPAISLAAGLARFLSERGALSGFLLDDAWVPLKGRDGVLAVESALALLPGSGGWRRRRRFAPPGRDVRPKGPMLAVGFSRGFPSGISKAGPFRGLWVDWGESAVPAGIFRMDPERILSGEVRL